MLEKNGLHFWNQRGRFSLERVSKIILVKTDNAARPLAVPSRLKGKNFMIGGPVSQKRYVIETNGFHIRNQRGRLSLVRISR